MVSTTSDEDEIDLMASFKKGAKGQTRRPNARSLSKRSSDQESADEEVNNLQAPQRLVAVQVPPVRNRNQYMYYDGQEAVQRVNRGFEKRGELMYAIELVDGTKKQVRYLRRCAVPNSSCRVKLLAPFTCCRSIYLYLETRS